MIGKRGLGGRDERFAPPSRATVWPPSWPQLGIKLTFFRSLSNHPMSVTTRTCSNRQTWQGSRLTLGVVGNTRTWAYLRHGFVASLFRGAGVGFEEPLLRSIIYFISQWNRFSSNFPYSCKYGSSEWASVVMVLPWNTLKYRQLPEFRWGERLRIAWEAYLR